MQSKWITGARQLESLQSTGEIQNKRKLRSLIFETRRGACLNTVARLFCNANWLGLNRNCYADYLCQKRSGSGLSS